jgi:hypothetical protein
MAEMSFAEVLVAHLIDRFQARGSQSRFVRRATQHFEQCLPQFRQRNWM